MSDLIVKAKQVEYLIQSLPEPDPEEKQVCERRVCARDAPEIAQVERLQALEDEMAQANAEYVQAVDRASEFFALLVQRAF